MKKAYILIMLAFPLVSEGQTTFSFRTGMANYSLADLKALQQSQLYSLQVPAKTISNFPSYYYYGFDLSTTRGNLVTSLRINVGSTGGRIYYSDYSGYAGSDQKLFYYSGSGAVGYFFGNPSAKFKVGFDLEIGVVKTGNKITDYLDVTGFNYDRSTNYKSLNLYFQPNFNLRYNLGSILLGTSLGYSINALSSDLYSSGDILPYKADLSGLRANVTCGYVINNREGTNTKNTDEIYAGVGAGLDYGGLGANVLVYPIKNVGVFTGVGYALAGAGVNGGLKFRFNSKKPRTMFFATAMYGYNTAVYVSNRQSLNKLFYGPSFGFGLDLSTRNKSVYSFQLIVPIRGSDESNYVNSLRYSGVTFDNVLLPIQISVGRRFKIS